MVFEAGIPGWINAGYPLNTQSALPKMSVSSITGTQLKNVLGDVVVLDIRTEKLYPMGRIQRSLLIPLALLSERYEEVPKGKRIVVVDHAGKQSLTAGRFLKVKGYKNVERLEGGLMAWIGKGYALEK